MNRAFRASPILALLLAPCLFSCGGGGPGKLGDSCDPAEVEACEEGLLCALDADANDVCQIPPGGECDGVGSVSGCLHGSTCQEYTDFDGTVATVCVGEEGGWCDPSNDYCGEGLSCARIEGGEAACHTPVSLRGIVLDSVTGAPIAGAYIVGINDERFAVTDVAVSAVDGSYELLVAAARDLDGIPVAANYTLRADADGYQTFPSGIRQALPINTTLAVQDADGIWVIEEAVTDVALIPLADTATARFTIEGAVVAERAEQASVLVVAEGASTRTAITGLAGTYTIFNVPAGDYTVSGYKAELELTPTSVSVVDAGLTGVDLVTSTDPVTLVSGTLQIVNAPGGSMTSVVLIVESTFDDTFVRGEVPSGLRAPRSGPPDVTGGWEIAGVPDGRYVVLASFENDLLVRDPDTNIAGTQIVHIEVVGGEPHMLTESFKITEHLAVIGPGADLPEAVSAPVTLEWDVDSSTAFYTVQVYNAYGELVWEIYDLSIMGDLAALAAANIPPPASGTVQVPYGGPLETGMYYQFRALSWRAPGGNNPAPISATEDLRGVFFVP